MAEAFLATQVATHAATKSCMRSSDRTCRPNPQAQHKTLWFSSTGRSPTGAAQKNSHSALILEMHGSCYLSSVSSLPRRFQCEALHAGVPCCVKRGPNSDFHATSLISISGWQIRTQAAAAAPRRIIFSQQCNYQ